MCVDLGPATPPRADQAARMREACLQGRFPCTRWKEGTAGSRASVHSAKITAGDSPASNAQKQTFCRDSSYSSTWAAPRHGALSPCRRLVECTCSPVALGRWTVEWNRSVLPDYCIPVYFVPGIAIQVNFCQRWQRSYHRAVSVNDVWRRLETAGSGGYDGGYSGSSRAGCFG